MLNILAGAVVAFIFGALWYTVLFGKTWARLNGFSMDGDMSKEGMLKPMVLNFLLQAIMAGSVYYLFSQMIVLSYTNFLKAVVIVWFGFSFTIYANAALWERKPWALVFLNTAYGVITTVLISYVIYLLG